jgi:hypothetical protein
MFKFVKFLQKNNQFRRKQEKTEIVGLDCCNNYKIFISNETNLFG